jgi:DNA-binding MarR family transcriptional regulator
MPYPHDPDSFGFLVNDVARMIRAEMDRNIAAAGLGLTPAEGRTLSHAARAGAVRQNVLAERIGVEAMTVSNSLDRLEAQGLIERRTDPEDRRAKLVQVTEAGHAVLGKIQPISVALRAAVSRGVAPDEWEMLIDTLKRARANLIALRGEASKESAAA